MPRMCVGARMRFVCRVAARLVGDAWSHDTAYTWLTVPGGVLVTDVCRFAFAGLSLCSHARRSHYGNECIHPLPPTSSHSLAHTSHPMIYDFYLCGCFFSMSVTAWSGWSTLPIKCARQIHRIHIVHFYIRNPTRERCGRNPRAKSHHI